jgi:hypothetical protein
MWHIGKSTRRAALTLAIAGALAATAVAPAAADPANKHTQTVTNSCGTVTFQIGTHNLINWFTLDSSVFVGLGFNFIVDGEIEASNPPPPGQAGRLESCDFIVVDEEGIVSNFQIVGFRTPRSR